MGAAVGDHVLSLLIDEQITRDKHLAPAALLARVRAAQPHLAAAIAPLQQAVQRSVARDDPDRVELEHRYPELQQRLGHTVENHHQAVMALDLLDEYLHRVQQLAGAHEAVHEAWQQQANALAEHL
jgi:hypothetical protein